MTVRGRPGSYKRFSCKNKKQEECFFHLFAYALDGGEWDVCMLVSESVFAVALMGRGGCLFGHEVCGHVVRAAEARFGVAELCVLAR